MTERNHSPEPEELSAADAATPCSCCGHELGSHEPYGGHCHDCGCKKMRLGVWRRQQRSPEGEAVERWQFAFRREGYASPLLLVYQSRSADIYRLGHDIDGRPYWQHHADVGSTAATVALGALLKWKGGRP